MSRAAEPVHVGSAISEVKSAAGAIMSLTQARPHPKSHQPAQMAELVDALASGASARKGVEVRVLFWAPFLRFTPSETVRKHPQKPAKAGFLLGSLCPEPVHPRACGEQNAIAP